LGQDYVLSPKDLCSIDFIDKLIDAKIHSFKIEGRMRSPEYTKIVTSVYRRAIDAYADGKLTVRLKSDLKKELAKVYNRGFSSGFYFGIPQEAKSEKLEHTHEKVYLGVGTRFFKKISVAEVKLQSESLKVKDNVLFIGKSTPAEMAVIKEIQRDNQFVKKAIKGQIVGIKLPFVVKPKDKVFLWKEK